MRLPRLVGQGNALDIAITGRKLCAQESYQTGLCEKVVPAGDARSSAGAKRFAGA